MRVEVITVGDELLIGQVVDTNSAWIGSKLNEHGIHLSKITSIGDEKVQIVKALNDAFSCADAVLMTGGLGPTKDDITKKTLAEYFGCGFKTDIESLDRITNILKSRGIEISDINRLQADVPEACEVLQNYNGTAPGMLFQKDDKILVSMPGVPFEMKSLIENQVLKILTARSDKNHVVHQTIMTTGIPESVLAKKIEAWEESLPENFKLAYLPNLQGVRLRITVNGENQIEILDKIKGKLSELKPIISDAIFSYEDESIEDVVGRLLKNRNKTISLAESCTGGIVASTIVSVPGASRYFKGSIVAYSDEIKREMLKINPCILFTDGAVSKNVVEQMAESIREIMNTDFGVATSGVAGPDGGTEQKPVGTTWIAVSSANKTVSQLFNFGGDRQRTMIRATAAALNMLRLEILNEE